MLKSPVVEFFQFEFYVKKRAMSDEKKLLAGFMCNDDKDEKQVSQLNNFCNRN